MILIPETMMEQKRMVTMPPRTQVGASARKAPNGTKRPARISQKQHAKPAAREAQRVILTTPVFCEKVVLGGVSARQARIELTPSASRPPWMRVLWTSVSTSKPDASAVAVMSPIDSAVETKKQIISGRRYSGAKPRENPGAFEVPTHRKEMGLVDEVSAPNMPVTSMLS